MSKKLSIIIFVLFLVIGGGAGWWYFSGSIKQEIGVRSSELGNTNNNAFPSGQAVNAGRESGNATSTNSQLQVSGSFLSPQIQNTSLRQIASVPTAGATAYTDTRGQTVLRYIERETGHTMDQPLTERTPTKVTDTTIPKVIEATFGLAGKAVVLQTLSGKANNLQTIYAEVRVEPKSTSTAPVATLGKLDLSTETGSLDGVVLPSSVHSAAISPDEKSYAYLSASLSGAVGIIVPADKTKIQKSLTTVYNSPISEWTLDWPSANTITFTSRAGADLPGFMYTVDVKTKAKNLVLKNIPGLTALMNKAGSKIIYSQGSGKNFMSYIYDPKSGVASFSPLQTWPEKCVWSTRDTDVIYCAVPVDYFAGKYPDDWYLGVTHFSDSIWKLNVKTGETVLLYTANNTPHDTTKLFLDNKEESLFFTDKNDSTIWALVLPTILGQ